jgi:hypothetical protein
MFSWPDELFLVSAVSILIAAVVAAIERKAGSVAIFGEPPMRFNDLSLLRAGLGNGRQFLPTEAARSPKATQHSSIVAQRQILIFAPGDLHDLPRRCRALTGCGDIRIGRLSRCY